MPNSRPKTLYRTLTVAENIKKELAEKAAKASMVAVENGQLRAKLAAAKEVSRRLEEEKKEVAEDRDIKVVDVTQLQDEAESLQN